MLIFGVKVELDMNFEYDILLPERMVRRMQKELTDLKCPQEDEYLVKITLTKQLDSAIFFISKNQHRLSFCYQGSRFKTPRLMFTKSEHSLGVNKPAIRPP